MPDEAKVATVFVGPPCASRSMNWMPTGLLTHAKLHPVRQSVLTSLQEHWEGLRVFVDHPEVPMDNSTAERVERGPVVLGKNSCG